MAYDLTTTGNILAEIKEDSQPFPRKPRKGDKPMKAKGKKKSFIEFNLVQRKPKTGVWVVRNINSQLIIGWIRWHNAWRQYCFFPEPNCVFSNGCLHDIINFIGGIKK